MRTLNESFTDQEFAILKFAKNKSDMTWHKFLLKLAKQELTCMEYRGIISHSKCKQFEPREEVKTK